MSACQRGIGRWLDLSEKAWPNFTSSERHWVTQVWAGRVAGQAGRGYIKPYKAIRNTYANVHTFIFHTLRKQCRELKMIKRLHFFFHFVLHSARCTVGHKRYLANDVCNININVYTYIFILYIIYATCYALLCITVNKPVSNRTFLLHESFHALIGLRK